ncbi:alpha/beta fold hydrolase [Umezawaea tangerina]|uniref:Alpha/beta hydrolase family protein n=1 Tax=Umezawaea tangerina TaxID=84725 RepID=A0A2T0T3X9_9PSEU|nr:hypothetical protein [Umezawaea tangerina]PRY40341.1 hypothetical protein CLV43_10675 [Umezawaea tangerina]
MAIAVTDDGYRLWYEAEGTGPAIVFPARFRIEQAALAKALAHNHRVVRYKPRQVVGVLEPDDDAGGPWTPTTWTDYPMDQEISDLHAVADAAGVDDFVLAGYSGMAALAGFMVTATTRATGLLIGGFPLLAGYDYWLGYVEGARAALLQAGLPDKANEHHMGVLLYRTWSDRDDTATLTALPGPKILWYGSQDGEPDCRMHDYVGGSAIARRIRATAPVLDGAGFTLLEFEGHDHIAALSTTDEIAPRLLIALAEAGW